MNGFTNLCHNNGFQFKLKGKSVLATQIIEFVHSESLLLHKLKYTAIHYCINMALLYLGRHTKKNPLGSCPLRPSFTQLKCIPGLVKHSQLTEISQENWVLLEFSCYIVWPQCRSFLHQPFSGEQQSARQGGHKWRPRLRKVVLSL